MNVCLLGPRDPWLYIQGALSWLSPRFLGEAFDAAIRNDADMVHVPTLCVRARVCARRYKRKTRCAHRGVWRKRTGETTKRQDFGVRGEPCTSYRNGSGGQKRQSGRELKQRPTTIHTGVPNNQTKEVRGEGAREVNGKMPFR